MTRILYILFLCLFETVLFAADQQEKVIPMADLHRYGSVANIEGGFPGLNMGGKIWANIAIGLDRPLIENETLKELTEKNSFPLKEASIREYNETQVNYLYLLFMTYYMDNAHKLCNKDPQNDLVTICFHIHRRSSAENQAKLLTNFLKEWYLRKENILVPNYCSLGHRVALMKKNVVFLFKKGIYQNDCKYDDKIDIVCSFSLVCILNEKISSGSCFLPKTVLPFDNKVNKLKLRQQYEISNHFLNNLQPILQTQNDEMVKFVNDSKTFHSLNASKKNQVAKNIKDEDFHLGTLLQLTDYFYPKDSQEKVIISNE